MHDSEYICRKYANYRAAGLTDSAAYLKAKADEQDAIRRQREMDFNVCPCGIPLSEFRCVGAA